MNLSPGFNRGEYVGKCTNIKILLDLTFKNGNNCLLHGKRDLEQVINLFLDI